MGCDIHMCYQKISKQQKREDKLSDIFEDNAVSINETDKWEYITDGIKVGGYQFSEEDRNYFWFGRMSNVRGNGPRITENGFPSGVNHTSENYNDNDNYDDRWFGDHSFSHVYLNTLLKEEWSEDDEEYMFTFIHEDIPRMVQYCERENLRPEEFRILIGYDS